MTTDRIWQFRVYINATASSKKKSHEDDNSVIEEIVEKLRDSNIKSYSHSKYGCKEGSYGKEHYAREAEDELWCIMQDNDKQPLKGSTVDRVNVGARSPVFHISGHQDWPHELWKFWMTLYEEFNVETYPTSRTEVHILPPSGTWTVEQVKSIAKSIIYYEFSFGNIFPIPESRHNSCIKNSLSDMFSGKSPSQIFSVIDDASTVDKVARDMCGASSFCSWDFPQVNPKDPENPDLKFLKFRQPRGVYIFDDLQSFIGITVAFVEAAALKGGKLKPKSEFHLEDNMRRFRRFLLQGAASADVHPDMIFRTGWVWASQR